MHATYQLNVGGYLVIRNHFLPCRLIIFTSYMRKLLFVLVLFSASAAKAQKKANPQKFAETITAADLKTHLSIVASAEMEGRETATEGQRKAAAYIENHFKTLGLLPANKGSYQMAYPVYRDSMITSWLSTEKPLAFMKISSPFYN
jgi:hypothetical protein